MHEQTNKQIQSTHRLSHNPWAVAAASQQPTIWWASAWCCMVWNNFWLNLGTCPGSAPCHHAIKEVTLPCEWLGLIWLCFCYSALVCYKHCLIWYQDSLENLRECRRYILIVLIMKIFILYLIMIQLSHLMPVVSYHPAILYHAMYWQLSSIWFCL